MDRVRRCVGFTFVEVLASLLFLAILIPVVVQALTVSNRAAVITERSAVATQLAENKLSEMMVDDAWATGDTRGEFGDKWPGYRWEMARADWAGGNNMQELTLSVFFEVQGRERDVRLTTLVSSAQSPL